MKVTDIIMKCAAVCGVNVTDENDEPTDCSKNLLSALNDVVEQIHTELCGEIGAETVTAENGFVTLPKSAVKILSLKSGDGVDVKYRYAGDKLAVNYAGKLNLTYRKLPPKLELGGEFFLPPPVTERILAYGVAAEYFRSIGRYADSAPFEAAYSDALQIASFKASSQNMPAPVWR